MYSYDTDVMWNGGVMVGALVYSQAISPDE